MNDQRVMAQQLIEPPFDLVVGGIPDRRCKHNLPQRAHCCRRSLCSSCVYMKGGMLLRGLYETCFEERREETYTYRALMAMRDASAKESQWYGSSAQCCETRDPQVRIDGRESDSAEGILIPEERKELVRNRYFG